MSSDGGVHVMFALACAEACALQSADASQFADALGGVALPLQLPSHLPEQEPLHFGASPVQSASASTLQLPVQVPEHSASAASSQVPWQLPSHLPAQLPIASRAWQVPSQVPRQVPLHSAATFISQEPEQEPVQVPPALRSH